MRHDLAQFFTPEAVVEFAFDVLEALGLRGGPLRAVDPACGDGAFLAAAARRFPEAELWGCDVDPGLGPCWRDVGLTGTRAHLVVQDGLLDAPLLGLGRGGFDLVVGNPPYGSRVPRERGGERIEAQFVRRFVDLARDGGWVAVVVPEGIAANAQSQPLRDWTLGRLALRAVVELPDATFAATGTRALTMLLVGQRGRPQPHDVVLASPSEGVALGDYLASVLDTLRGAT